MRLDTTIDLETYRSMIGTKVVKTSGKPFKSGEKVNTVKGITVHPELIRACFIFEEDDSYVECWRCKNA